MPGSREVGNEIVDPESDGLLQILTLSITSWTGASHEILFHPV